MLKITCESIVDINFTEIKDKNIIILYVPFENWKNECYYQLIWIDDNYFRWIDINSLRYMKSFVTNEEEAIREWIEIYSAEVYIFDNIKEYGNWLVNTI